MHICVSKLTTIGSDNGLSPGRRRAMIWTNSEILLIRTLRTNFSEILSEIHIFSFKKMHSKMSSAKWWYFCLGLNVLHDKRRSITHPVMPVRRWVTAVWRAGRPSVVRLKWWAESLRKFFLIISFLKLSWATYYRKCIVYQINLPVAGPQVEGSALTHLPLDKMPAISQTTFSNAFSWMKNFVFWLKFHRSLFLRVQLTINQLWFR